MSSQRSRRKSARRGVARRTAIETLESRQMFSAEPLGGLLGGGFEHHQLSEPDFWYDASAEDNLDARIGDLEQTLAAANQLTGLSQARNEYGFLGYGQTVAVIDSGIAWDHPNLGGGFGSDYRVVGGWDFSEENDANPYDDGPSGAHGTHVAGIVGATANSAGDEGVAPGVDLVGLRVFNDLGAGYFGWVEKALRWVHTNRNAFANPITAVNLSLGTAWNAATVPSWSMLEEEFAQLKADGIFIAVSAGNNFTTYNTPGLSYPAASSSVVPVMSVDDNGSLSYFSQRHERAIAAPGRTVRSTVPDYVGNQNGRTDDWASFSGTSMAAPYVAAASVLVREAMQFIGYTNITQDTIYQHMMSTADDVFDAATSVTYKRLNVAAALDALMPEDDFGSTAESAFDLGTIGASGAEVSGTIGKRSDVDNFRFTAAASGTVTFAADATHYLDPQWSGSGTASNDGLSYTINVVAGQSYAVGLGTGGGVGHFELSITAETVFTFVDWGPVSQQRQLGIGVNGESWYCVTAQQAGYLTAEAFYSAQCQVEIAWFDANLQQVASGTVGADSQRVDRQVGAGEQLFLRVSGQSEGIDVRLTNLVSIENGALVVRATDGDDTLAFTAGSTTHQVIVNGVEYQVDATNVSSIQIDAGEGRDSITITGAAGNDIATLRAGSAHVQGAGYEVTAIAVEDVVVVGGGGRDTATLYDSTNNDELTARPDAVTMRGSGYENTAADFDFTTAFATAGNDLANFHDSAGNDSFTAMWDRVGMQGGGYWNTARGFDVVVASAVAGGSDAAILYDSAGNDTLTALPDRVELQGSGYWNTAASFDSVVVLAINGGMDKASFYDSAGNDSFTAVPEKVGMQGASYRNTASGFDFVVAYAIHGGSDQAQLYDSAGSDTFTAMWDRAGMQGNDYWNTVRGFEFVAAYAVAGGADKAIFYDSTGDDTFTAMPDRVGLQGVGFWNTASKFESTIAYAISGGFDQALFYDSAGDDAFTSTPRRATLQGPGYLNIASGFDQTAAYSIAGGVDRAVFYDSAGDDLFSTRAGRATMQGTGYRNIAAGFREASAYATSGGYDRAELYDSALDMTIDAAGSMARIVGDGFSNAACSFDDVIAHLADDDVEVGVDATDFLFTLVGQ